MRILGVVAAALLGGCWSEGAGAGGSAACGAFQCADLLTLNVTRRDAEAFIPGEYTFTIDDGAVVVRCALAADGSLGCVEDTDILSVSITPKDEEFTLRLDGTPVALAITVDYNGERIGAETLAPRYQMIVPDDPDCDTCLHGSETIGVQSPPEPE